MADSYSMPFFETSSKLNTNVFEAFTGLAKQIAQSMEVDVGTGEVHDANERELAVCFFLKDF